MDLVYASVRLIASGGEERKEEGKQCQRKKKVAKENEKGKSIMRTRDKRQGKNIKGMKNKLEQEVNKREQMKRIFYLTYAVTFCNAAKIIVKLDQETKNYAINTREGFNEKSSLLDSKGIALETGRRLMKSM